MGRLIIDGNKVYELDEKCLKHRLPNEDCGIEEKYVSAMNMEFEKKSEKKIEE